jgi:hypothetical protein
MLAFIIFGGIIVLIIFAVLGMIEGKTTMSRSRVIRSLYFYLASLVTLGIVVGSLIFLINTGLKAWVFTDADPVLYRIGAPPVLFFTDKSATDVVAPVVLTCTKDCTLTSTEKASITSWQDSYTSWLDSKSKPNTQRASDLVAALSFLIVALPFYFIHFRTVQKDAKNDEVQEHSAIRPTYFYFVSLAALLMIVIAGGMLINLALKTWVIKSADQQTNISGPMVKSVPSETGYNSETAALQSVIDCGAKCGIEAQTVTLAKQWMTDYNAWQTISVNYNNKQRQAASTIPFVALGIPLFWYHWSVVRKELRDKKDQPSQPIQKV